MGGVVPGPVGAARTVIAHAGESISGGSGEPAEVKIVVQDGAVDPNKIAVIARGVSAQITREMGRNVYRGLPGRGGGLTS
jgi:hypothetical protein